MWLVRGLWPAAAAAAGMQEMFVSAAQASPLLQVLLLQVPTLIQHLLLHPVGLAVLTASALLRLLLLPQPLLAVAARLASPPLAAPAADAAAGAAAVRPGAPAAGVPLLDG
jgi:hypothetical protein